MRPWPRCQNADHPAPCRLRSIAELDRHIGARPQPLGRQFGGPMPEAIGDVASRHDEEFAGVVARAHDQVGVWVVGAPVIDRHPLQPRAQVAGRNSATRWRPVSRKGGVLLRDVLHRTQNVPVQAAEAVPGGDSRHASASCHAAPDGARGRAGLRGRNMHRLPRTQRTDSILARRHERRSSPAIRGEAKAILYPVFFLERS